MRKKKIVVKADILFDGKSKYENRYIVIEGDKILEVTEKKLDFDFEGIVTPGFIDAHSHIGMDRDGEPSQESETNDHINQINPTIDPVNSIYFDDKAFKDAVDFGVLYSCIVPGSGNLIGGKAMVIKNFAKFRDAAVIKHYGYKMALGYNPRSTTEWKGERPSTRMGAYAMLEKKFDDVLIKYEKAELEKEKKIDELNEKKNELTKLIFDKKVEFIEKEYNLSFSSEDFEILEMLSGEKTIKVHVHKDDDIRYLIDLVEKYGLKVSAEHTCDVFNKETYDMLGEKNIPVVYGPLGAIGYKVELKHASYKNAKLLMESKAFYGLMTDHPVIPTYTLRESLKYFLIHGMSEEEAISVITYKNAKILEIDDKLGSIEKGKIASLVIWDKNPFYLGAYPKAVIAEGKVIRDN